MELKHNQLVVIKGYPYRTFTVGSVEGYAAQYNEDPQAALERNLTKSKANPWTEYCIAWINPNAAVLSASPAMRAKTQAEIAEAEKTPLMFGQQVRIEDRWYVVRKARNDNVFLEPSTADAGKWGHPGRSAYTISY